MPPRKKYVDGSTKQQRYKARNAQAVRDYQREYMAKRRAAAKLAKGGKGIGQERDDSATTKGKPAIG